MINFPHEPLEVKQLGSQFLVVYKWGGLSENSCPKVWENVELFDEHGCKLWTVNGMEKSRFWDKNIDTFVATRMKLGRLQLTSFSGNSYDLDLQTGGVIHFEFHK